MLPASDVSVVEAELGDGVTVAATGRALTAAGADVPSGSTIESGVASPIDALASRSSRRTVARSQWVVFEQLLVAQAVSLPE
ncbi:MAG: hypothetical protein ACLQNU_03480, partial [Candidatus Dormibacteria bacterium]